MAYCSKCGGEMKATEAICPHCGYDFPAPEHIPSRLEAGYRRFEQIALVVAMVFAGFACLLSLLRMIVTLTQEQWKEALIESPIAFFLSFAVFVVISRVLRIQ